MKFLLFSVFLFCLVQVSSAQSLIHPFGEPTVQELNMSEYKDDPEAAGVVLYERGHYQVELIENRIYLTYEIHRKTKVLDASRFKGADVAVSYYHGTGRDSDEKITNFRAITHNGSRKLPVNEKELYHVKDDTYWANARFSFPDVKDGSILEYSYKLISPYFEHLKGWSFINYYPTLYSELTTELPGNFIYSKTLYGDKKLDVEDVSIKKSCFHLPGYRVPGDCEVSVFVMKNIPALNEEEFMLSPYNYSPYLKFELVQVTDMVGRKHYIASSWKTLDDYFNADSNLGRELTNSGYMKKQLPNEILNISDKTERAKAVYYFIQKHMHWNQHRRLMTHTDIKNAFTKKTGHSSEINLILINALEAAGLDAKAMLIATRNTLMPSKVHPVLTGFNYLVARLDIDGKIYHLDATSKNTSFGLLPIYCLNGDGRVLDFKKGSFWEPVTPYNRNVHYVNVNLKANENGQFSGTAEEIYAGYIDLYMRVQDGNLIMEELLKRKQNQNEQLNLTNFEIENRNNPDQPYKEKYDFTFIEKNINKGDTYYISTFTFQPYMNSNPFVNNYRKYPIDLYFPFVNTYTVNFDLGNQYEVLKVPENKTISLPNNDGILNVKYEVSDNSVVMRMNFRLNNYHYPTEAYAALQEFFTQLMEAQSGVLELRKIN